MSETGNKLVLAFGHSINTEQVTFYRDTGRKGNTLNQIGQVMDELVEEAANIRTATLLNLLKEWTDDPSECGCETAVCMGMCLPARIRRAIDRAI